MKKRIFVMALALLLLLEAFAVPALAATYTKDQVVEAALGLIYKNEGSYGSVNKNDNGAVSVGKLQWHANRALNLLKKIVNKDTAAAKEILGDDLYNEITTSSDWTKRTVTDAEKTKLKALLTTDNGKAVQDAQAKTDVTKYINHGMNLGITDAAALIYFADLENQGGSGMSARVAKAAKATAGSYSAITLDILHNAALADSVAGKYTSRRNKSYNYCKAYDSTPVELKLAWTDYSKKPTTIYNTDALLSKTLSVSGTSINNVTSVGISIYNGTGSERLVGKTEKPTPKDGVINMFYTVNDELGYTLTKNTQYQYRFQATISGKTYYSPVYTFVTGPNKGYTVSFNANGGSCSTGSKTVPNGAAYGDLPTATRTNYTFDGWYTTSSGGTQITASSAATLSGNQTLYAHWTHVCANGHTYNSGTVTKQPTATSTGVKTYTCTVCGATKTESIPATGIESTPMYRMYNPNSGEHFYTGSTVERDDLVRAGWSYEGVGWYAPTNSGDPVYRLYNPYAGEHHYTTSAAERDNLVSVGWKYEGVGWLTASSNQVPIYRVYNPNEFANNHHYTASLAERNYLISLGWRDEGIGWYGVAK